MMTEHYYSQEPQVESREALIEVTLRGERLRFYTDRGVFSKKGIDFGTRLLIESLDLNPKSKVIDVGCGYGPIGLTVAKESVHRQVILVDINERALHLAQKNAALNQVEHVQIIRSDLLTEIKEQDFDYIISNPPIRAGKQVIHRLFEESRDHLNPGGELWLVIQKKQGAPSAFEKLKELFSEVEEVTKKKGYRIFRAKKGVIG